MSRMRLWREVVRDALKGGKVRDNAEVYKRVAKEIGAKELTTNQKAKVRQQLQIVGEKPGKQKRSKKTVAGKWKLKVKLATKKERDRILSLGDGTFHEKEHGVAFFTAHKVLVYEYPINEGDDWISSLLGIAIELESAYGEIDTSIEFLTLIQEAEFELKHWYNLAYSKSPTIAAEQAPSRVQEYSRKSGAEYQGAIENALAFSFTLYIPI
jgi:hypothetical protein